ncbi:MAG: hypothetical protein EBT06_14085 [Gammaproteobacteria bacterium]|nr:hypothetical protein [Gammaproteobacteria bacterium]
MPVTPAEIEVARGIMDRMMLPEDWRVTAMRLYNEGKSEQFLFDSTVETFRLAAQGRIHLLRLFIALQMEAALADGTLSPDQERLLLRLCERLHFSRYEFYGIQARMEAERKFQAFGARTRHQQRRSSGLWCTDETSAAKERSSPFRPSVSGATVATL